MDYIFFTDADLQFDISELQNLLIHVADNPVVIGYRAPRRDPLMRLFNAWGWNRLNRMLFGLKVRDIDCAFKIFKRNIVQRLELRSKGNMIGAETLIRLANMGVKFKEVPVSHLPRTAGSQTGAKPSAIVRALGEMIRLYRGDLGPVTDKMTLTFILVGAINTAIDIVAYILLTRTNQFFFEHLVLAKLLSFMLGLVSSLVLHRLWTFSIRERPNIVEALRFYSIFPAALVLNVAMMGLFIEIGIYDLLSLFLTTAVTFAFNFTLANLWIHHERSADIYRKVRKQSMVHNAFTQSQ
jgi:putative flippase GtrA